MNGIRRLARLTRTGAGRLAKDQRAIASLEFGLIAPMALYSLMVASDLAHGLEVSRRLTTAADTIAELVSQTSQGQSVSGTVTDADLAAAFGSIVTTFPDVLSDAGRQGVDWKTVVQPIVTQVVFGPSVTCPLQEGPDFQATPRACSTAKATWSVGFDNAGFPGTIRNCGALAMAASDEVTPSLGTMPPSLYGPGALIVVDLYYKFTPMFTSWITGTLQFHRTAYLEPRFFTQLNYTPSNGTYAVCTDGSPVA